MESNLATLCAHAAARLQVPSIADYANALNGLQLENDGRVTRIAAAVDASLATVDMAVQRGCDLLIVHHGLFWSGLQPVTANRYRLFKRAMEANLAVYSVHLPLDAGLSGNSKLLLDALDLRADPQAGGWRPFFEYKGTPVGFRGRLEEPVARQELVARLRAALGGGEVRVCPGGGAEVRELGVVTGGAGSEIKSVAEQGIDTFITGEGPHWTYVLAEELEVNVLYGGHYATETFGVKHLAAHLSEQFGVPWEFIDHPTGL